MLTRLIKKQLDNYIKSDDFKIFFIWGPRRSGKTTILEEISKEFSIPIFNFDLLSDKERFINTEDALSSIVAETKIILIDEVQNYPEGTVSPKYFMISTKLK